MANEVEERRTERDGFSFPSLQREMNRLFDHFRVGLPMADNLTTSIFGSGFPAIDVVDEVDSIEVSAELPGVKEDDLDVAVSGEVLTLKGEKSFDHEEKDDNIHRIERRYGTFRRQIPLGFVPEQGAVTATFADGVLKLKIAKPAKAKAQTHKIDIKKS